MQQRSQFTPRRQERFDNRPRNTKYFGRPQPRQAPPRLPAWRPTPKYVGPEVKLFCNHWVREDIFEKGCQNYDLRCPKCGMSWRGYKVISNRKSLAKKELYEALRRAHEKTKEVYAAPKRLGTRGTIRR